MKPKVLSLKTLDESSQQIDFSRKCRLLAAWLRFLGLHEAIVYCLHLNPESSTWTWYVQDFYGRASNGDPVSYAVGFSRRPIALRLSRQPSTVTVPSRVLIDSELVRLMVEAIDEKAFKPLLYSGVSRWSGCVLDLESFAWEEMAIELDLAMAAEEWREDANRQ